MKDFRNYKLSTQNKIVKDFINKISNIEKFNLKTNFKGTSDFKGFHYCVETEESPVKYIIFKGENKWQCVEQTGNKYIGHTKEFLASVEKITEACYEKSKEIVQ